MTIVCHLNLAVTREYQFEEQKTFLVLNLNGEAICATETVYDAGESDATEWVKGMLKDLIKVAQRERSDG